MQLKNRAFAELFGTFFLVFAGVGSAVFAGSKIGNVGVALAFGLALLAMVYTIGPISGCHINPAVTVGVLLAGKIRGKDAGAYIAAQIAGAIIAAGSILAIARDSALNYKVAERGLGANGFGAHSPDGYSMGAALVAEIILTSFLVITVLGSTDVKAPAAFAGISIGLALTLIHLVGIPITNTSVNPARSIGSAVFVGGWAMEQLWVFILGPILGAIIANGIYSAMRVASVSITVPLVNTTLEGGQAQAKRQKRSA
jgi:aquaporin Z